MCNSEHQCENEGGGFAVELHQTPFHFNVCMNPTNIMGLSIWDLLFSVIFNPG